jgi:predicted RNA polymerase sigma factor
MALLLRDVVGLSYTEIAESLEVTLATVKWRIWKAREDVQLALAREGIEVFEEREVPAAAVAATAPAAPALVPVPVLAPPALPAA